MLGVMVFYAGLVFPAAYVRTSLANLLYHRLKVGPHYLRCEQRFGDVLKLYLTNIVGVALSLGLAVPWAKIRMAQYRASRMGVVAAGELDVMALEGAREAAAYGEAAADLGDIGFDLA
jgi:uncharacterized membrane protein YjgN (DUF898 family)